MALAHGSGQACYGARAKPACEDCRSYARQRQKRDAANPNSYRYKAIYGLGIPGQMQQDSDRRWRRIQRNDADQAKLDRLMGGR